MPSGVPTKDNDDGKPRNSVGRKGKWRKGMIEEAYLYCLEHHGTDFDLACHLGIGYRTLYDYMERYPHFAQAIQEARKKWRQAGCGSAVKSLYKMLDTNIIEVPKIRRKKKRMLNPKTKEYEVVVVEQTEIVEKHVFPPNLKAIIFVLLNQDPDNWKRNPEPTGDAGPSPADLVRQAIQEFRDLHKPAEG